MSHSDCTANFLHTFISHSIMQHHGIHVICSMDEPWNLMEHIVTITVLL